MKVIEVLPNSTVVVNCWNTNVPKVFSENFGWDCTDLFRLSLSPSLGTTSETCYMHDALKAKTPHCALAFKSAVHAYIFLEYAKINSVQLVLFVANVS